MTTRPTATIARHAAAYATGSIVGGISRAVLLPVIARTLAPEEFGVLALLLAATNLMHLVLELGLVTALIKFHSETDDRLERHRLRSSVFLLMPALDVLLALPFLLGRDVVSRVLFGTGEYAGLVVVALAIAWAGAQFQLYLGHLRADDRSRDFAVLMAVKGLVSLGVTLTLVFGLDQGVRGFLLGNLAGPAFVAALMIPRMLWKGGVDLSGARARLRRLLGFGVPLVPAALGLWALAHLDTWLLRVLTDLGRVGVYGFASEICLPIALLLTSIQLAWPSFAFSRARAEGGPEEIARVYRHLFVVLVGGALAVAVLRGEILQVLGTESYAASARVIPPLALATVLYGLSQTFGTGLQVAGDTRRLPLFVLAAVVLNAGLNLATIPRWGEVGAAWSTVATNVVLGVLILRESNRQFRLPFEVGRLSRIVLAAIVVLLAADATAGLPAAAGIPVRIALVLLFPPLLIPARAMSREEVRALPRVALEILGEAAGVKLSVVMPTHGRRDLVERTLRSLARQEDAPPFEVIVVDDGADPGLGDHVRGLALALDARVIHLAENRGRAAARNSGIDGADGDVVVFLDSDMEVVPGFVAAHARAHDGGDTVALGNIVTAPEIRRGAFVEYIDSRGVKKVGDVGDIPPRYFMTGNSSVAAPLLARAGGFDEEFDEYGGEDTEMGYRLGHHGGRFRYAEGALSYHLDLNSVPRMARRLRRYGETMLPVLVRKVPEARRELRLDLAEPARPGDGAGLRLRKAGCAFLCRRAFWAPAAELGERLPGRFRVDFLFDFVRAASYLDGYRASLRRRP